MDLIAQSRQRVAELEKELKELRDFLSTADRIGKRLAPRPNVQPAPKPAPQAAKPKAPPPKPAAKQPIPTKGVAQVQPPRPTANPTADMADTILRAHGQLHVEKILDELYKKGWKSSGDRRKDYKNLHITLSSKPQRFRAVGGSVFAANPVNAGK